MKLFDETDAIKKYSKVKLQCDDCSIIFERLYLKIVSDYHRCKSCTTKFHNSNRPIDLKNKMRAASVLKCKGRNLKDELSQLDYNSRFNHGKLSGCNNPNYGGKYSRGFADRPITGSLEENYGLEKAKLMRQKRSINASGENNGQFGKQSPMKSGRGLSGIYKNNHFRSLLELSVMIMLEHSNKKYIVCESHNMKFSYTINDNIKTYFPDFYLPDFDEFIEVKPSYLISDSVVMLKLTSMRKHGKIINIITEKDVPYTPKDILKQKINDGELVFHSPKCDKFIMKLGVTDAK